MNAKQYRISPVAQATNEVKAEGTVVVVKSGAITGARIFWEVPPGSSGGSKIELGEPLINGEAYVCPTGKFGRFWVNFPRQVVSPEELVLQVFDCATPTIVLNNLRGAGWHYHMLANATVAEMLLASGAVTIYDDGNVGNGADVLDAAAEVICSRGWIGGGVKTNNAFRVTFYEYLAVGGAIACEIGRMEVNQADDAGNYSCSFCFGARNMFNSVGTVIRNGGLYLPYPPLGLKVKITPTSVDIQNVTYLLYERDHAA